MKTTRIAVTTITAMIALTSGQARSEENVFVRGKDKFLEVTEGPKNVVKKVGKGIGFGFRDAWRGLSSLVTGKEPEPDFPVYQPAPYNPPPYGYTSPRGTNYAPGYGPPIPTQADPSKRQPTSPYRVPPPPYPQPSPMRPQTPVSQTPATLPPVLAKPKTTPLVSQPKPEPKPQPKVEPKKTVSNPVTPPTQPETKPSPPAPATDSQPQFAVPIPGKSGMVYSPFTKDKRPVDVRDIPAGTVVKDPYTNKLFRVP